MTNVAPSQGLVGPRRSAPAPSPVARIASALAVWRQRRNLARLPDSLRKDVGLSVEDVHREAHRPFWDVPDYWRR